MTLIDPELKISVRCKSHVEVAGTPLGVSIRILGMARLSTNFVEGDPVINDIEPLQLNQLTISTTDIDLVLLVLT
jgi:hypothetical protein